MANIYTLLVGINQYDPSSSVPHLQGCTNDVQAMQTYLEGRVGQEGGQLQVKTLLNEAATRQAVINGFRNHLGLAGPEDVALFFYAGHGSQEQAPEEFWHLEPDRLNETLVCYDSRCQGSWDLADKELAKLIAEVAANNPHMVVILDCCHSGSGTRGDAEASESVRRAPTDKRQRPIDSFIVTPEEIPAAAPVTRSLGAVSGWRIPQGRHVLLAACQDIEEAKEYSSDGEHRGAFSYFLLETLQKANGSLTYRDLFKRTSALVQSRVSAQAPQLEASVPEDLDQPFLGGAIRPRSPHFLVSCHPQEGWIIDGGSIHGIPQPKGGETTVFALFLSDMADSDLGHSTPLGTATVMAVKPTFSRVELSGIESLSPEMGFKAVVKTLPLPPMGVHLLGDEAGVGLLRGAIMGSSFQPASLYVRVVEDVADATFQVVAQDGEYRIKRPADDRILLEPVRGFDNGKARETLGLLEHLARWTTTLELQGSPTSRIAANAIRMEVILPDQSRHQSDLRLSYSADNKAPKFQIKLTNTSSQRLYCTVLDLTERFAISAALFEAGGVWLDPGQEAYARQGELVSATVPKELWEQGITEFKDVLKLIVSPTAFDGRLLEQQKLNLFQGELHGFYREDVTRSMPPKGMLNRLMKRIQTRDIGDDEDEDTTDDWMTSQITITTVRPRETVALSAAAPQVTLMNGITIQNPEGFSAQARLTTVTQSTRDLGSHILPPLLRDQTQAFQFTASRATDPGLSALELRDVKNSEAVTAANPLKLVADVALEPDAMVLPVAFDGEFYLPLGHGISKDNQTEITIEHLPEPISEGQRSLGGAIRIFFQKVVRQKLGLPFEYPFLRVAEVNNGEVTYITDPATVASRVAQAQRIALYIHGIIGDTESMVPSIETAIAALAGEAKPLKDCYDLVLAFDYESLNTSIETHAQGLKQRLESIGLGPNHGKTLHIIAHSMGGLVSRWFIEQEGGKEVVQHLILLGTPSGGSPWPQTVAGITTLLTMVLNGLSKVTFPIVFVSSALKLLAKGVESIETIDVTLDQMDPNSDFIKQLAITPDPGIPYTVIAGNIALIPADHPQGNLRQRLMERMKGLMELPFFGIPNDLAVTVESIKAVPPGRQPAPVMVEVACDHLVYFSDPVGVKALGDMAQSALTGTLSSPELSTSESLASEPFSPELPSPASPSSGLPRPDPLQDEPSEVTGDAVFLISGTPDIVGPDPVTANPVTPADSGPETSPKNPLWWWIVAAVVFLVVGFVGLKVSNPPSEPVPNLPQSGLSSGGTWTL
ncbi:caspase [Leptolyngbya sp. BL0902]|uniref:caspase family protein n=1 Tax=Leptolyngbya sp. BL0902 TaxID=1115757 RepID=UPI0018E6E6AA|nr:caspase family protein [Leptolyngbya sp. BL0902]QQE65196.1 caspase [Leptolyngbya sp. BL0902]